MRSPLRTGTVVGVLLLGAAAGLLLSLYGPALPELRAAFGVGGAGSALVLSAHFAGAMAGIAWWGLEQRRLAARTMLVAATALLVGGAVGVAFAPAWPLVLAAAFGLGVGFGAIVVAINVVFAEAFGERTPAMLNLLGACFGAGSGIGGWEATSLQTMATAGLALAHLPALAPFAYILTGLALGPVFPAALAWLAAGAPGAEGRRPWCSRPPRSAGWCCRRPSAGWSTPAPPR
jgi:hypothetical protein